MKGLKLNIEWIERKDLLKSSVMYYSFLSTVYGEMLAVTLCGRICALEFVDDRAASLQGILGRFGKVTLEERCEDMHRLLYEYLSSFDNTVNTELDILLVGTEFQYKVWSALLRIPYGSIVAYQDVAEMIGNPRAVRAVASAIASNPVSLIIPCHRVVRASGDIGGYRWGIERKISLIEIEKRKI